MLTRRRFVFWISSAVPLALVARRTEALAAAWIGDDAATLRALAEAILPSELGNASAHAVAGEFQRWVDGYRENTELVHGYGTSVLRFSKASPRARWAVQLDELRALVTLPVARRRDVVRKSLEGAKLDRMPDVASATHVAVALLAFYYASPQAADLCHQAKIGRDQCRPLATAPHRPLPLARGPA
jgi:hypothetical protein